MGSSWRDPRGGGSGGEGFWSFKSMHLWNNFVAIFLARVGPQRKSWKNQMKYHTTDFKPGGSDLVFLFCFFCGAFYKMRCMWHSERHPRSSPRRFRKIMELGDFWQIVGEVNSGIANFMNRYLRVSLEWTQRLTLYQYTMLLNTEINWKWKFPCYTWGDVFTHS